jgi:hypothetical protein
MTGVQKTKVVAMSWFSDRYLTRRRRRLGSLRWSPEVLETRALLADGITPTAGPSINAVVGVPITNAVFATFAVTDPSGEPGDKWRALIDFGDGQKDGPVIPVQKGDGFEFLDTHTYEAPGTYSVTVMISVPGSHTPNNNTVATDVLVSEPAPTPTPTPTPTPMPPPNPHFTASGLSIQTRSGKLFNRNVALFKEPHSTTREFHAIVNWGDGAETTLGHIRVRRAGRFAVTGSHRFLTRGVYKVTVTIQDTAGRDVTAVSSVDVTRS